MLSNIKNAEYVVDDMCGILESDEIHTNAIMSQMMKQVEVDSKREILFINMYIQFFHQMVAKMEASTIKVLTMNGYKDSRFDRNKFYKFKDKKCDRIKSLDGFQSYDTMYAIWNFVKHNSLSTFETAIKVCPEVILKVKDNKGNKQLPQFKQGDLAIHYLMLSPKLIVELLDGVGEFFKAYCEYVFNENYEEAQWNYEEYFLSRANREIEGLRNPLGLPAWI